MTRLILILLLGGLFFAGRNPPPIFYYVDIPLVSGDYVTELAARGYDIGGINHDKKTVSLIISENELEPLSRQQIILEKRPIPRAPDSQFKNYQEVGEFISKLESDYPHLVTQHIIGKTLQGRNIYALQLTARQFIPPIYPKPAVLFDAMHHSREVMTVEVALDIADYLTKNYATDAEVRKWLNHYDIWVVPMVNPDGNHKVWNSSSMWRKNARGGHGVDNNRNYPHAWNACNGSSGSKHADTYRGSGPGSEPETVALMDLTKKIKPKINISYHSYSEIVIYPFGCRPKRVPSNHRQLYEGIGDELASRLVRDSGFGRYRAGTSYELLYNVDGGSVDWMYAEANVLSFVVEINGDNLGFQPSYSKWRDISVERQRAGWKYILEKMEDPEVLQFG